MKQLTIAILVTLGFFPLTIRAELEPINVQVRIEIDETTIFSHDVEISDCLVSDISGGKHAFRNHEAVCALEAAAQLGGFNYQVEDQYIGLYLLSIAGYEETIFKNWLYWVNYQLPPVGIGSKTLSQGDEVLFALTAWDSLPLNISLPEEILADEEFIISTLAFNYQANEFQLEGGVPVLINDEGYLSNTQGELYFSLSEPGEYEVFAFGDNYIRSPKYTILVTEPENPPEPPAEDPPEEPISPLEPIPNPPPEIPEVPEENPPNPVQPDELTELLPEVKPVVPEEPETKPAIPEEKEETELKPLKKEQTKQKPVENQGQEIDNTIITPLPNQSDDTPPSISNTIPVINPESTDLATIEEQPIKPEVKSPQTTKTTTKQTNIGQYTNRSSSSKTDILLKVLFYAIPIVLTCSVLWLIRRQ